MKDKEIQAINKLNNIFKDLPTSGPAQEINNNVQILVQGLNNLDQEVKQKTFELQNKDSLLVQKEQKVGELEEKEFVRGKEELIETLPKLYPNMYPSEYENWPNDWGRTVIDGKDIVSIEEHLPKFKMQLLKNELIDVLPKLYPSYYPIEFKDWPNDWGRTVIENNSFEEIKKHLPNFRQQLVEKLNQSLLSEKMAKDNELKKLADKEVTIARLKEQLSMQELETQNKDQLLLAKELEKKELLVQKEEELKEKIFAKNQVIDSKEKEAYKLQIELLTKQLEFHKKESELKDKVLLDAQEIVKQKDIINTLQEKLLAFVESHKKEEISKLELSVIHFKVEESIVNGNLDEIKELSKYLSQLMKDPIEKEESLDISELLNNLSPVLHVQENLVQNPLSVINNFDINHVNTTHSVYPSGEGSSFSIIQEESFN